MSWSRRSLLGSSLALAACGFSPVNAPGGTGHKLRGRVAVAAPSDRNTFLFAQQLEERLGRAADPAYRLTYSMSLTEGGLAEDAQGVIRRFNVHGRVDYTLADVASGAVLHTGVADNFTGYASAGTTLASLSGRRDALQRLSTILADEVVRQLQLQQLPA